jgi:hypothetical protein
MKITYIEIANMINRTKGNMDYMKIHNPEQLELLKVGAICQKYNITLNDLEKVIEEKKESNK